jgi:VWFA-related protein
MNSGEVPGFTYRKNVEEVRLDFFATDSSGRAVSKLGPEDFAVVDNEWVVRDFRSFSPAGVANLDVAVLVDLSESLSPHFQREIGSVVELLARPRWLTGDAFSILTFAGTGPRVLCASDCLQTSPLALGAATRAAGSTPLYDALVFTAQFLGPRRHDRASPIVVLFSDGVDTISRYSFEDAVSATTAAGIRIYPISVGGTPPSTALPRLADATGGRYFQLSDGALNILSRILEDQHAGYIVTYQPPSHEPGMHSVRILPTRDVALQFHSRDAYYFRPLNP